MPIQKKLLTIVAILVLIPIVPSGDAKAGAIAYANDSITNISFTTGIANNFTLRGTMTNSRSFADLDSIMGTATSNDPLDAKLSCQGSGCAGLMENDFALHPPHLAQGDAMIAANLRSARNDALVNLSSADIGSAFGDNTLRADFSLTQADMLTLAFTADPFIRVLLQDVSNSSSALARIVVDIDITERFGNFDTVFSWQPDGAAGGIMGGNEIADPFSLNKELTRNVAGMETFDPIAGAFSARTNQLVAGDYRIDIFMSETAFAKVPEPSSLALLGLGMLSLLGYRRMRAAGGKA